VAAKIVCWFFVLQQRAQHFWFPWLELDSCPNVPTVTLSSAVFLLSFSAMLRLVWLELMSSVLWPDANVTIWYSGFKWGKRWWGFGMQWHQLDHMQTICTLLQTDNHTNTSSLSFLLAGCSSWHQTNSVKTLKAQNQKNRKHNGRTENKNWWYGKSCSSQSWGRVRFYKSVSLRSIWFLITDGSVVTLWISLPLESSSSSTLADVCLSVCHRWLCRRAVMTASLSHLSQPAHRPCALFSWIVLLWHCIRTRQLTCCSSQHRPHSSISKWHLPGLSDQRVRCCSDRSSQIWLK